MLVILCGNEPYLIDFYKKKFTLGLSFPEMNLLTLHAWDKEILDFLATYPVMDEFRAVVLYLDSLKELEKSVDEKIISTVNGAGSQHFIVIVRDADKRTRSEERR